MQRQKVQLTGDTYLVKCRRRARRTRPDPAMQRVAGVFYQFMGDKETPKRGRGWRILLSIFDDLRKQRRTWISAAFSQRAFKASTANHDLREVQRFARIGRSRQSCR